MRKYLFSEIKLGKEETKNFLRNQYLGCCQICGFTFKQKNDGSKYFELFDWFSEKITKQKLDIIEAGSSLCLCANCHSSLKYGDFKPKFIKELENYNLQELNFNIFCEITTKSKQDLEIPKCFDFIEMDMYKVAIRLLNQDKYIFYTEEHFLHFYNLLTMDIGKINAKLD